MTMKWFAILWIALISCGQNGQLRGEGQDSTAKAGNVGRAQEKTVQTPGKTTPDSLIIPGKKLGRVEIGAAAPDLEKLLGKPDASDAAMGKAWLTWKGGRDEHNNATELNVYTAYADGGMDRKTVQEVRTTSSAYATAGGLHVYAALEDLKAAFPGLKKKAHYNEDGRDIVIYDEQEEGIAFELASANGQQICTGILVHEKGKDVTEVYRFLHPAMKFY